MSEVPYLCDSGFVKFYNVEAWAPIVLASVPRFDTPTRAGSTKQESCLSG
jgi:hypothetical protein